MAALRRGLSIARDSGNRHHETNLALILSGLQAEYGDPLTSLDNLVVAIGYHHDAGNAALIRPSLAVLAGLLHRMGRHEPSATIAGFAFTALTTGVSAIRKSTSRSPIFAKPLAIRPTRHARARVRR